MSTFRTNFIRNLATSHHSFKRLENCYFNVLFTVLTYDSQLQLAELFIMHLYFQLYDSLAFSLAFFR